MTLIVYESKKRSVDSSETLQSVRSVELELHSTKIFNRVFSLVELVYDSALKLINEREREALFEAATTICCCSA